MDEVSKMIPLWSASKPDEYIFIPEKPEWACVKCGKSFWRTPTRVETSRKDAFGNQKPLQVWIATSECFVCNESHRWLLDPDTPVDTRKDAAVSETLDNAIDKFVDEFKKDDFTEPSDYWTTDTTPTDIWKSHIDDINKNADIPFSDWQKKFGETDLQAYIRWLKAQRRRREDDDDPNDAS